MKVIGIRPVSFAGENKEQISGKNIYVTYPLDKGEGNAAERLFITDDSSTSGPTSPEWGMRSR